MYTNTNMIVGDFQDIISGQKTEKIVEDSALNRYSTEHQNIKGITNSKSSLKRIFVLHNFVEGRMVVKYSYERYNGSIRINGSKDVYSIWRTQKNDRVCDLFDNLGY